MVFCSAVHEYIDATTGANVAFVWHLEYASENTATASMSTAHEYIIVLKTDAVVVPTRAVGVEYSRVTATLKLIPNATPRGVVICVARLGTNDLEAAIAWWKDQRIDVWGVIPERVGIASGPEAHLSHEGLEGYDAVLRKALRGRR